MPTDTAARCWIIWDGRGNDWGRFRWRWLARLARRGMDPLDRFTHITERR